MRKLIATFAAGLLFFAASAQAETPAAKAPEAAKTEVVKKVTITNQIVDGKKTWLPADVALKEGEQVELTLVNPLPDPHGFTAPGMAKDVIVNGKETKVVTFTAPKEAGTVKFSCQLHPAHVGGNFTVQ